MIDYASRRYALLNRWDPSHLDRVDRLLDIGPDDRVLEVGCGSGHLIERLDERGVDVIGIDANPNASELASSDRVLHMRAEFLDFPDEEFDTIVSIHAIEHFEALEKALSEMTRVLKKGGTAMYVYPAEPVRGLYAIPTSIILHGTPFMARQVHCHKLWPAKLARLLKPLGMEQTYSRFHLLKMPQFVSVFEKIG